MALKLIDDLSLARKISLAFGNMTFAGREEFQKPSPVHNSAIGAYCPNPLPPHASRQAPLGF
jgi:hypothetical protein